MMRMLIVMLGIAIVACGICMAATIFCPLSPVCAAAMSTMVKCEQGLVKGANKYEKILDKVLPVLSAFEKVVAMTTPYVGAYKGNKVSKTYKPLVTSGMAISPSMVPFVPSTKKLGLPVQDMEWDDFCEKSAELAVEHGFSWITVLCAHAPALGGGRHRRDLQRLLLRRRGCQRHPRRHGQQDQRAGEQQLLESEEGLRRQER